MIKLNSIAYKLRYTAPDPDDFDAVASWVQERQFKCAYRSITASENVRAGREASNTGMRVSYFPMMVSFGLGDRIKLNGLDYDIIYIPARSCQLVIDYVDTKAVQ